MKSVSFDRAADLYDETHGLPQPISDLVADSAAAALPGGASILEIGIGTRRISLPVMARGLHVTGVDLSAKMMRRLLEKVLPGSPRPALVQADITRLPFLSASYAAVLAVHVFHLIPDWRAGLNEVVRVLRPGGVLLTGSDWRPPDSPQSRTRDRLREIFGESGGRREHPGAQDFAQVHSALLEMGARMNEWVAAEWTVTRTLERFIDDLEAGFYSYTWDIPPEVVARSMAALRQWVIREYGSLEREFVVPRKFVWQRYQWG